MAVWLTIEGMASATSLILTILASLRAASRLDERIVNRGSIGLMDGPPILGPRSFKRHSYYQRYEKLQNQSSSTLLLRDDNHYHHSVDSEVGNSCRVDEDEKMSADQEDIGVIDQIEITVKEEEPISPLWEHTEAFRRAAILGLVFDELLDDENLTVRNNDDKRISVLRIVAKLFTDIIRVDGTKHVNFRGVVEDDVENDTESHDDLAIAVAVEAGLISPPLSPPSSGTTRVRGGGGASRLSRAFHFRQRKHDSESSYPYLSSKSNTVSNNPIIAMVYWFVRELSAPLAVIPAWRKVLCTYWREQKENQLRKSRSVLLSPFHRLRSVSTGRCTGQKPYDSSHLDFDASISGKVHIPYAGKCTDDDNDAKKGNGKHPTTTTTPRATNAMTTVRVKAYAPKTFRDLRNKCFRVTEGDYAKSILNAMNVATATPPHILFKDDSGDGLTDDDERLENNVDKSMVAHILHDVLSIEGHNYYKRVRRRGVQEQAPMPYISFQSNSKGAARAGTFFFFTADGAYMIKTVKKEEAKAFLDMLPEYHRFMSDGVNGRNSLLTRIFGMYSVQFPPSDGKDDTQISEITGSRWDGGLFPSSQERSASNMSDDERIYLVMHSVFPPEASAFVKERFDLKGSTVGRECSQEERKSKGANAVLKDLDLKREVEDESKKSKNDSSDRKRKISRHGICIGRKRKMALMAQLKRDVDLLCRCSVLDYSLLVGVVDMEMSNVSNMKDSSNALVPKCIQNFFSWLDFPMPYYGAGMTKVDGGTLSALRGTRKGREVIYYLGVIDFLQPWTIKKRLERDLKGLAGYDKSAISCVAPTDYADRFLKFFDVHVT